jgi:hypothetical protein
MEPAQGWKSAIKVNHAGTNVKRFIAVAVSVCGFTHTTLANDTTPGEKAVSNQQQRSQRRRGTP